MSDDYKRSVHVGRNGNTEIDTDTGNVHVHTEMSRRGSIDIDIYDLGQTGYPVAASTNRSGPVKADEEPFDHKTARAIFKELDIDGSCSIDAGEAHKMLSLMQLDKEQIDTLFERADIDNNHQVSLQEFDNLLHEGQLTNLIPPLPAVLAQLEVSRMNLAKSMTASPAMKPRARDEHGLEIMESVERESKKTTATMLSPVKDRMAAIASVQKQRDHDAADYAAAGGHPEPLEAAEAAASARKAAQKKAKAAPSEAKLIEQMFNELDLDDSGYIDGREAVRVLSSCPSLHIPVKTIRDMFVMADLNCNGIVSLTEFEMMFIRVSESPSISMHLPPLPALLEQIKLVVKGIPDSEKQPLPSLTHLRPPRMFVPSHMVGFSYLTDKHDHCACRLPGTSTAMSCSIM